MSNNVYRILGIDPGETIGLCWITYDIKEMTGTLAAEQYGWHPALAIIRSSVPKCHIVAVEEWRLYASAAQALVGDSMHTVEMIGRIVEIAWEKGCALERHRPDVKDPAWRFLEKLNLPVPPTSTIHARDAAAQAAWTLRGLIHNRRRN